MTNRKDNIPAWVADRREEAPTPPDAPKERKFSENGTPAWMQDWKSGPTYVRATDQRKGNPAPRKIVVSSTRDAPKPPPAGGQVNHGVIAGTVFGYFALVLFALIVMSAVRAILP